MKKNIDILKDNDIYSMLLFVLYRMKNIPDYAVLSELIYILDKESILKLCEYYGGNTIKIPTIEELKSCTYSLLLYDQIEIKKNSIEECKKLIPKEQFSCSYDIYIKLKDVLNEFEFKPR